MEKNNNLELKKLKDENSLLKKLIENQINIDRIDEVVSIKNSTNKLKSPIDFILGCWEYDRSEQIFIVDDVLKNFFKLDSNIMDLDFYRSIIPEEERDEIIDTILLSFENKIKSLKIENTIINPVNEAPYSTLTLMNNFYNKEDDTVKSEGFLINITDLIINYQHSRAKLSNEKYIDNVAVKLNNFISTDRAINFLLNELRRYRPSKASYLVEIKDESAHVSILGGERESIYYTLKLKLNEININWERLEDENSLTVDSDSDEEFFAQNKWIENNNRTLIIIPGRITKKTRKAAIIDVTNFFDTVISSDLLTYHALLHIFEGAISRIEEEFRFYQNNLNQKIIMEETPYLMCQINSEGDIKFINKNFSKYFNIPLNEFHDFNFYSMLSNDSRDKFVSEINNLTPQAPESDSDSTILNNGAEVKLHISKHAIFNENEDIVLTSLTAHDK